MVTTSAASSASTAAWYPEPVPTSSTRSVPSRSRSEQIVATTNGCEIVWRLADRKRAVVVGVAAEALRHEEFPRHAAHRVEHALVGDSTAAELPLDHLRTRDGGVDGRAHLASVRSPAKRAA